MASELKISVQIAPGEFFDRWSILRIKHANIQDINKRAVVLREMKQLEPESLLLAEIARNEKFALALETKYNDLLQINRELWEIEDEIRECEKKEDFGPKFIHLARAVYLTNDRRAKVKREISDLFGAQTYEVKSYV